MWHFIYLKLAQLEFRIPALLKILAKYVIFLNFYVSLFSKQKTH